MDIEARVHESYWEYDINCANTMLLCLGEFFGVEIASQTKNAAVGLHGAGGFRAQCGLVEGALMFIGIYLSGVGWRREDIVGACYGFADAFTEKFGALRCLELRPGGFREDDPPHACEKLTCAAIRFTCEYVETIARGREKRASQAE